MLSLNPNQMPLGALSRLPNEVLQNIAFLLVAANPLGPPPLRPLLLVNKTLHGILDTDALKARIFRLSWDYGAVLRRSFKPYDQGLAEQLVQHLFTAYMLMLDNDGKNYAQLEWAGIDTYVDRYIRNYLFSERDQNMGWPLDSTENACALWLAWMTIRRDAIFDEPVHLREQFIQLVLPYVLLTHRYPNAEAPPNHFNLPLPRASSSRILTTSTPATPAYPIYLSRHRVQSQVHFGARPDMSPPLVSVAAKLLFVSRRERNPIVIPRDPPPGLTYDDYEELNRGKAAELPRGARWDWEAGFARAVNCVNGQTHIIKEGDEESKKWDTEWWRRRLCFDIFSPSPKFTPGLVYTPGSMRGVWQGRIYMADGQSFANMLRYYPAYPGHPGGTSFTEASVILAMIPTFFNIEEHHRICHCPLSAPCQCDVDNRQAENPTQRSEKGKGKAYSASQGSSSSSGSSSESQHHHPRCPTNFSKSLAQTNGCGIIPVPAPLVVPKPTPTTAMPDGTAMPAVLTGPGSVTGAARRRSPRLSRSSINSHPASSSNPSSSTVTAASSSTSTSTPSPSINTSALDSGNRGIVGQHYPHRPDSPSDLDASSLLSGELEEEEVEKEEDSYLIDYGMKNAWFPGWRIPSVHFTKRKVQSDARRRDEIVFTVEGGQNIIPTAAGPQGPQAPASVQAAPVPGYLFKGGKCESLPQVGPSTSANHLASSSLESNASSSTPVSECQFVYETFDPTRRSSHNASQCLRCKEWEKERVKQKRVMGEQVRRNMRGTDAVKMLDEYMRDYGKRKGQSSDDEDDSMDERMETLDVSTFGSPCGSSSISMQEDDSELEDMGENLPYEILGDDLPNGQPALYDSNGNLSADATRRVFDKERVGAKEGCNGGVRDIILTGETDPKHVNWHRQIYTLYGRVRPFDGLVGFLRVDHRADAQGPLAHMFICGYVVAENTFAGEWRMASANVLMPAWSGPFVMSRRTGEEVPSVGGAAR